jgi:hypothetical protein
LPYRESMEFKMHCAVDAASFFMGTKAVVHSTGGRDGSTIQLLTFHGGRVSMVGIGQLIPGHNVSFCVGGGCIYHVVESAHDIIRHDSRGSESIIKDIGSVMSMDVHGHYLIAGVYGPRPLFTMATDSVCVYDLRNPSHGAVYTIAPNTISYKTRSSKDTQKYLAFSDVKFFTSDTILYGYVKEPNIINSIIPGNAKYGVLRCTLRGKELWRKTLASSQALDTNHCAEFRYSYPKTEIDVLRGCAVCCMHRVQQCARFDRLDDIGPGHKRRLGLLLSGYAV